jgi:serine-type D-Ala-D-Ala carboxypeptidase/endopeptidase (penicillin-binding protein 4)
MLKRLLLLAFLLLAAPALAQQQAVEAALEAAPKGSRFGLLVVDEQGREVVAIAPDQRFIPASNTKLFTTAAAYAVLTPDPEFEAIQGGTAVFLRQSGKRPPDLVIRGEGGVSLSTAPDCTRRCLAPLVERALGPVRKIRDVVGDDGTFADQRWSPGMSWNNIGTDNGTAISALIVDDNELPITVAPGAPGTRAVVTVSPYFTVENQTETVDVGETRIAVERAVNSRILRVYGTILADAKPWRDKLGIDDGAHYAAWSVRQVLGANGIAVTGKIRAAHRPFRFGEVAVLPPDGRTANSVREAPVPLDEEVAAINKFSQNLHAEALLRRIGIAHDGRLAPGAGKHQTGSREAGLDAMKSLLDVASIPRAGYDFSDGSGMSTYNRLSPRATVALLRWAATQPWGEAWYASLPVAGVDGTLKRRFVGTPLAGNLTAKTGTLNATNALSGRMRASSGRTLTFAFFANDVPDGGNALPAMEAALLAIAAAN